MKLNNETKIGILVFLVLSALAVVTYKAGDFQFRKEGYELIVLFKEVDGVDTSAPVRLNGMEVGLVKNIAIRYGDEDTLMELTLRIDEDIKIHENPIARVKNLGLFGEKYVSLNLGDTSKPHLKPGSIILGEEPPSMQKLLSDGQVIATNLKEISIEVNERLKVNSESIDVIMANIRQASSSLVSITDNLDERLTVNEGNIDEMLANLNSASKNLDEMSYDLKINPWKLLYKEKSNIPKGDRKSK